MSNDSRAREQASRDIAAALSEIRGRRDQLVAEYDERLGQLDAMVAAVGSGELAPKVARHRVRQLLGERNIAMARGVRAGRTQIGMRLPAAAQGAGRVSVRPGQSSGQVSAELTKVRGDVASRIVTLMMRGGSAEARLELALLGQVWSSLDSHLEQMPSDTILLASLLEYATEARSILEDLASGGTDRLRRLLEHDRQLLSQIAALGGAVSGVKEQLGKARSLLSDTNGNLQVALQTAISAFGRLRDELAKLVPRGARTLLDDVVQP